VLLFSSTLLLLDHIAQLEVQIQAGGQVVNDPVLLRHSTHGIRLAASGSLTGRADDWAPFPIASVGEFLGLSHHTIAQT